MLPRTKILNANDTSIGITQDISTRSLQTVSVGDSAGKINTGTNNAFIGVQAGAQNTSGSYVTAIGYQAAAQNANSSYSTMIGAYAGAQNISGNEIVFAGFRAGELNRFGGQHVGIGAYALRENVSGNASVAIGYRSGEKTADGGYNTMIGAYSGQDNRSGNFNTMGGYSAGRSGFLGNKNTYFGAYAGYSNSFGSANSLFGYQSGANLISGDLNVAIGAFALQYAHNAYSNVIIGPYAAKNQKASSINNVLIGANVATNANINNSVIIGSSTAQNMSGEGLVIIGNNSARNKYSGNYNILIGYGADLASSSNNYGISIGNLNTLTYTNSVSIGIGITNQNIKSVLVGNTLSSDAAQSVVIGNDLSIQSVIFFKDLLYYNYANIAALDGSNIFNITNIDYTNTLISTIPKSLAYQNATAHIITSNVINSITNPELNKIGPFGIGIRLPYDLIQNITNHGFCNAYALGSLFTIQNANDISSNININKCFFTNSLYITCNLPDPTNLQYSNYYYTHELYPYIHFIPGKDSLGCNLPIIPVIANITQINPSNITAPIYIGKTVAPPIYNFNGYTIHTGKSLLKSSSHIFQFQTSSIDWTYTVNSNMGINLPNCNILYSVSKLPKYGTLNNTIYNSNTILNIQYTPFIEYAKNTTDTFEITPIFSITDNANSNYGLPSSNCMTFNITFNPSQREIYPANKITIQDNTIKTLLLNDILLDSIPTFDLNTNIFLTYLSSNVTLLSNQIQFTSNDVVIMNNCNISQYPDSLAPGLYNRTVSCINIAYSCNLQFFYDYLKPPLNSIINESSNLLNTMTNLSAIDYTCLSNINIDAQNLIYLSPLANNDTFRTYTDLNKQLSYWSQNYPSPFSQDFLTYLQNYQYTNLYTAWSNLNILQNLFNNYTYPLSQNVARNLFTVLLNTEYAFTNLNYTNNDINYIKAIPYTNLIHNTYYTLYNEYYNCPRLFMKLSDFTLGKIQLKQNSQYGIIGLQIETSNISIPIISYPATNIWENIEETITYTIATNSLNLYQGLIDNLTIDNYYIQKSPSNGILNTSSSLITNNLSNITYSTINPWIPLSSFDITISSNNKYLTRHYNYIYDNTIRTLPIKIGVMQPISVISSQYNQYTVNTITVPKSNIDTTIITSNQGILIKTTIFTPIQYDPLVGYRYTTSNITNSNIYYTTSVPYGTASNIISSYFYTFYTSSNTYTNNIIQYNSISSNIISNYNINYPTLQSNTIKLSSNIINSVIYFAYNNTIYLSASNQNHYNNYDINTGNYLYHSDDAIQAINTDYNKTQIQLLYNQNPLSITVSNVTIHNNYNRYESYIKLNNLFLYSPIKLLLSISRIPDSLLFINSTSTTQTGLRYWNSTDNIYIKGTSYSVSCNIELSINNTYRLDITTVPVKEINILSKPPTYASIEIDANTMRANNFTNIFKNDSMSFIPTDIHFINIYNGSIINKNTNSLIMSISMDNATFSNMTYLASGRYQTDTLEYFYSSNTICGSSNFKKIINLIQTPYTNIQQSFNIGLSTYNNTLNQNLFYYSIPNQNNIGIRFQANTIPSGISFNNISEQNNIISGNIFNIYNTSNIQFISNNVINNFTIAYDVINMSVMPYQTIPGYANNSISFKSYLHYEFPSSTSFSLIIQNFTNWRNTKIGSFWNKIDSLNIDPLKLEFILDTYPNYGYINNSISYYDIINNNIRYIPYNNLNDICGLSNDVITCRLLYNSNQVSPKYTINIKNYISRFTSRIINASSFTNYALPPDTSYGMKVDHLVWRTHCNIQFQKNSISSKDILWTLESDLALNYSWKYIENVATYNLTYTPNILNSYTILRLTIDESDSVNLSQLINYVINKDNDTYFYINSQPSNGIIQNIDTGNTIQRFTQNDLYNIVYQHFGKNLGTNLIGDSFSVSISSSPYDLSLSSIQVQIDVAGMPTVVNNYSQYTYINNKSQALSSVINIPPDKLSINSGYIHIIDNTLSNIKIVDNQYIINYLDDINFQFTQNYILTQTAPYPLYGFDFTYNNSMIPGYINRLSKISIYSDLYKNHFTGYLNQNTDINNIIAYEKENQNITYTFAKNLSYFSSNIFSTLLSFETIASLANSQSIFLENNKFNINFYSGTKSLLEFTFTKNNWYLTAGTYTTSNLYKPIINETFTTLLIVNYDNFNNNCLSLYWNYNFNATNANLLNGYNINVDLSLLDKIEISVPIWDPLNYISSSNFVRKIDGGDLYASYSLHNYNISHIFNNLEFYIGNLATLDTHSVILGKSINVRGTNNVCIGNNFSTSGDGSLIIGNNIGGGGTNEINSSIIVGNSSFNNSAVSKIISIGNSNLNNLRDNTDSVFQLSVNKFLSQYPIIIGNFIDNSKIDFNINIGNVFLKTSVEPNDTNIVNNQIYLGISGEKVGIGYNSNEGLTQALCVKGDIIANSITVNNFSFQNLTDTISCIKVDPLTFIDLYYIVSSSGVYTNNILNVRKSLKNDNNVVGICLKHTPKTIIAISGHTKVWCATAVNVGDFLASTNEGVAYAVHPQTIIQSITTNPQQNIVVKKVINGVPIFVGTQSKSKNTNIEATTTTTDNIELISNYTFAKSTTNWDPDNYKLTPWIETMYTAPNNTLVGLIGCII